MGEFRRAVTGVLAAGLAVLTGLALTGCGAPAYVYAADGTDHAYFKVPASWRQVSPQFVTQVQEGLLGKSLAGAAGGSYAWSRVYTAEASPTLTALLAASNQPVVYASVQNINSSLRAGLSFNVMQDLLFPVTAAGRKAASAAGEKLTGFELISNTVVTNSSGMRGINELYEYTVNGQPDAFDQTVVTNSETTKLYLLLVQCYQACFIAHRPQIAAVVNSFTVDGS
jgi:hypothetical protein